MAMRWSIRWIILAILIGVAGGVGTYTLSYADGLSYLSDDPRACVNCHLMQDQFESWRHGPHHATATCNDCHVPSGFPDKYIAKARNGYHHSMGITFQPSRPDEPGAVTLFSEPIRIKGPNSQILQGNCLRCHDGLVHEIVHGSTWDEAGIRCVHCHAAAGHGARR